MPSRVVRAEINESESLGRVSALADLLFRCLIVAVDDYGRFKADPALLAANLFPRRDEITAREVSAWLDELENADGDGVGPIRRYVVDGKTYLYLPGWERHRGKSRRAATSRFPAPPPNDDIPGDPRTSAGIDGDPRTPADIDGDPPGESGSRGVGESRSRGKKNTSGAQGALGLSAGEGDSSQAKKRKTNPKGAVGKHRDRALALWPMLVEVAKQHGAAWRATPGSAQIKILCERMDQYTDDELLQAILGHVRRNSFDGGDPLRHLTATTVFRGSNVDANIEQGSAAQPADAAEARRRRAIESGRAHLRRVAAEEV